MPGSRTGTLVSVERPLVTVSEKAVLGAQGSTRPRPWTWSRPPGRARPPQYGIPYVVIRAVSDGARDELPGYLSRCMDRDGGIRRWQVALHALAQPSTIRVLRRMQRRVEDCTDRLAAFVEHFLAGTA